jgi:HEAT repeat protein
MRRTLILLLSLAALALPVLGTEPKDDLYRAAQRDLDSGHWGQAIEKFGQVAGQGGSEADAALYWKAYAENKAGRSQQALASLRQLAGSHPKSAWLDDGKALEVEIRGDDGNDGNDALSEDDELKLYALNGLLGSDPARAWPLLQKFLQGNHPPRLKEQALFVISQSDSPEARKTLVAVARGTAHPELQEKAVEYLGIAGGDANVQLLDELYRSASRPEIRKSVIRALGLIENQKSGEVLRSLYASAPDPSIRKDVLEAFFIQQNARALIDLYRTEKDRTVRREIVRYLSMMDSEEATQFVSKIFEG